MEKSLAILHNGWDFDYHLIIKQFKELKGQTVWMLRITFSVPTEKKLRGFHNKTYKERKSCFEYIKSKIN